MYRVKITTADFGGIQAHLIAWGLHIISIYTDGEYFVFSTSAPIPNDQLDHLGIEEVT